MPDRRDLESELSSLGRSLVTEPPGGDLEALVLARLEPLAPPVPTPGLTPSPPQPARRARRRLSWAIAASVMLVLALIPPVRAAVVELLHIGGVVVREEPRPTQLPTSPAPASVPATGARVSVSEAQRLIGADIAVPAALGVPSSVVVLHDGRVAELTWSSAAGPTRLDVFVGSLSWGYVKTVWQAVTPTQVEGHEAVWFGSAHLIEWVDRDGATHSESPRLAGPTLVWVVPSPSGEVTYRLEGPTTLTEALRVARSAP